MDPNSSTSPKHAKFLEYSAKRLIAARKAIRSLGNLAHPYNYEAEEADWERIINPLRTELQELEEAARAQILTRRRRAERARQGEQTSQEVGGGGFSVERTSSSPREPWTIG